MVDFYRPPASKAVPGWRGPATATDISNISHGIVSHRWQSHAIERRVQDIRHALMYSVFLSAADLHPYNYDPFTL
eukprot:1594277-Lingulodinium_polyedra.AAC.1